MFEPTPIRRRRVAAAIAALAWPAARAAQPAVPDFGSAIDKAGRQRMLSQRIVKAYCQIGLRVTPEASKLQLVQSLQRFESQLDELQRLAPDARTRRALQRSAEAWRPFRRLATGPVERAGARRLQALDAEVLRTAHEAVLALQAAAGTSQARLVNTSGRQRMLSQRLAKLYMLRAWGVDSPDLRDQMDSAGNEFAGALESLRNAPENTAAIAGELEGVALQWEWFAGAIGQQGAFSYTLVVADASESILESMDLVTGLYATLAHG